MKFNKVYIELTNICGLECSFCPTKTLQNQTMSLDFFEKILIQLQKYTNRITYHIFGDPLILSNIKEYLDLTDKYNFKVEIVTTGYYIKNFSLELFLHPCIKQINFSLNSFDKNNMNINLENYLKPMVQLAKLKIENKKDFFINFRLWNLDKDKSANKFNKKVFKVLGSCFDINLNKVNTTKAIRLDNKVLLDFDSYFQWPSLDSIHYSNATCYGLKSHFGILSSGIVVPCCLDSFGVINLGDLNNNNLDDILNSSRVKNIINGFKNKVAIEELCQKCTFKDRFSIT